MKAALDSLKSLQEYSDLPRDYLLDLGERLFQYFDSLEDNLRLQHNLQKKYKRKFKSRYIPKFSCPPGKFFLWDTPYKVETSICMITFNNLHMIT